LGYGFRGRRGPIIETAAKARVTELHAILAIHTTVVVTFARACGANTTTRRNLTGACAIDWHARHGAHHRAEGKTMFIVQGKPREPEGIEKATADSREEALETASDFLNRGFPFVTVLADGRVYTVEEFSKTVTNGR
jgi:hypothetical protein